MKHLTKFSIGAAATACAVVVIATAGPSVAERDPPSSPSDASQNPASTAPAPKATPKTAPKSAPKSTPTHAPSLAEMDQVRRWANPLANLEDTEGFGRVSLDFKTREVLVEWKRKPPAKVRAAVGVHAHGVRVIVRQVKYSQADIDRQASKLFRLGRQPGGIPVQGTCPNDDMDGMIAGIAPADLARLATTLAPDQARLSPAETKTRVAARFTELTGMPVTVIEQGPVVPLPARLD